ncbi:MAG: superfamily hydrolase [Geobacteraceae bacterium]|jgi:phosphoglycolate phosphatase|nr:superfamily hydrolase [Geobacteraceae bacterium]
MRLVIFDLDGTVIDSLDDLTDTTNHMLSRMGRNTLGREEVRTLVGQGAKRLVERALPGAAPEELERALGMFLTYNEAHIVEKTRLYPGVREALALLRDRGFRLAVISNKNEVLCRKVIHALGVDGYFEAVVGADTTPFRKPSPEPVLRLLHDFGVAPAQAAIIGDSINDVAAGQAAGVVTVGCTYGYGSLSELETADYLVGSFPEIPGLPIFR